MLSWGIVLGCLLVGQVEAAARAIPVITTPVAQIVDTVKMIGWIVAPLLLVGTIFHARVGGIGFATVLEVVLVILVIGIVVYADEIILAIKPGVALASPSLMVEGALVLNEWQEFGRDLLAVVSGLAWGMQHVRHARRV